MTGVPAERRDRIVEIYHDRTAQVVAWAGIAYHLPPCCDASAKARWAASCAGPALNADAPACAVSDPWGFARWTDSHLSDELVAILTC